MQHGQPSVIVVPVQTRGGKVQLQIDSLLDAEY